MNFKFDLKAYGKISLLAIGFYSFPLVYPQFVKFFNENRDTEVPPELVKHVKKVAHLMGILPDRSDKINVFIANGMESMSFGVPFFPYGAYIGLPRQVLWSGIEDAKKSPLYKKGFLVNWETDFGTRLATCLTPSGSQINFRIAHELAHLKSNHLLFTVAIPPMHLFSLYVITWYGTPFLSAKLGYTRTFINLMLVGTWILAYLIETCKMRHHFEFEADRLAAKVGRGFAEGGLELFFRQRQLAILLAEPIGESSSTHPSSFLRQKRLQEIMIERYQYEFD